MPSWGEIAVEIATAASPNPHVSPLDLVRRKYLATVHALTGRAVICYATRWTAAGGANAPPGSLSISYGDVPAFMEALYGIKEQTLDLIIHSPGGSAEAADAIVTYLRSKFSDIRVFVPHMAMSAATMICCAADTIVMGKHSFIGPIDPQITLQTGLGMRQVAAQAILDQFGEAVTECNDPAKVRAWLPMLTQYGPDLLVTCGNANKLAKTLVSNWLEKYMFAGSTDAALKAESVSDWMADHNQFKTHGKPISREEARTHGLNITDLEADQNLQDAVLSVYHCLGHTFAQAPHVVKIVENHLGKAFIESAGMTAMPFPIPFPSPPTPSP
jgi:Serine dehydrogenase proteinase